MLIDCELTINTNTFSNNNVYCQNNKMKQLSVTFLIYMTIKTKNYICPDYLLK